VEDGDTTEGRAVPFGVVFLELGVHRLQERAHERSLPCWTDDGALLRPIADCKRRSSAHRLRRPSRQSVLHWSYTTASASSVNRTFHTLAPRMAWRTGSSWDGIPPATSRAVTTSVAKLVALVLSIVSSLVVMSVESRGPAYTQRLDPTGRSTCRCKETGRGRRQRRRAEGVFPRQRKLLQVARRGVSEYGAWDTLSCLSSFTKIRAWGPGNLSGGVAEDHGSGSGSSGHRLVLLPVRMAR